MVDKTNDKISRKMYIILFALILFTLAQMPIIFYIVKFTKNPIRFNDSQKHYVIVESSGPALTGLEEQIKAGDIGYDQNGDENIRVLSAPVIEPKVFGRASFNDGDFVDIISKDEKIVSLRLRVRYDKIGNELWVHNGSYILRVGGDIAILFSNYAITTKVTKIVPEE